MGKKKAHKRRVTQFEKDLQEWMKDPVFKEKYETALGLIALAKAKQIARLDEKGNSKSPSS